MNQNPQTTDEKLDVIIDHLARMDRRDRIRTWGHFVHSLIALIPIIIFVWSTWYFATHATEIMGAIAEQSAKAASKYTQEQSGNMLEQLKNMIPKK